MTPLEARRWGRHDHRRIPTRDFPPEVLALVDEKHGGRYCVTCRAQGLQTPESEPLEIDHMQPLSKGGDNAWSNLRWLCRSHNRSRCNRPTAPLPPVWARGLRGSSG